MEGQTCEYRHEKRLLKALIIPTITYGSETWTMTKKMRKKINACEMYIWRKMRRISWMEKRTNDSVRMDIGIEKEETLQQNSAKSKVEVLWTCHAIRWFGKGYDVSIWRGKEKTRKTKEKVDGRDT